jgi:hypothetical protein
MYSTYDRFKWTALLDAAYIDNGSAVYADVKRAFPGASEVEHDQLVQRALLELLDAELIVFFWGEWDGDTPDRETALPASRAEVEIDLARSGPLRPRDQTVWFTATETGRAGLEGLPPQAFLSG